MSKLSKHKLEGKHALKYDTIFKGKKIEVDEFTDSLFIEEAVSKTLKVDSTSMQYEESIDSENYVRSKKVKEEVYKILKEKTNIDFSKNRRKPSKEDFNGYFTLLVSSLKEYAFSNTEIFNELSFYFSDNLFKMLKLLDNNWRDSILDELRDHMGKATSNYEIINRNIYIDTELEFRAISNEGKTILVTGCVIETDYDSSTFKVNSYENIYTVQIDDITRILNNTKLKFDLNTLDYIDFL